MNQMFTSLLMLLLLTSCSVCEKKTKETKKKLNPSIEGYWSYIGDELAVYTFEHDSTRFSDQDQWYPYYTTEEYIIINLYTSKDSVKYKLIGNDTLLFIDDSGIQINVRNKE